MFDRIARKYDLVNRVLSFGIDISWRNRLAKLVSRKPAARVVDVATGTGDVIVTLSRKADIAEIVGVDPSQGMLNVAQTKITREIPGSPAVLVNAGAEDMPFPDGHFDFVTIAFGIRNVPDVVPALREMYRVLKPGGEVLILEFSLPKNPIVKAVHLFYLRHILPRVGGMITGNREAYNYLNKTIESFPYGEAFGSLLKEAGFDEVTRHKLTFGIATIYQAKKL